MAKPPASPMLDNEILRHPPDIRRNVLAMQLFYGCTEGCNKFGPERGETLRSRHLLAAEPQLLFVAGKFQLGLSVGKPRPLTLSTPELGNPDERVDSVQQPCQR